MGLQLDWSQDWRTFDNLESGRYTSVRNTGDMVDGVSGVLRRAIGRKELAASGGVYRGDDTVFMVPRDSIEALAFQGRFPKPGDLYQDGEGQTFTVLGADAILKDGSGVHQMYRLTCRNLVVAYDLQHRIDIQRPSISYDAAGVKLRGWPGSTPYSQLACRVQLLTQDMVDTLGMTAFKGTHAVMVSRQVTVGDDDRIKWVDGLTTRYLDIKGVRSPERIDELPVIDAELMP